MTAEAGISEARVLVIAIDDKEAITELAQNIRVHHPHVHVIARALDSWHVHDLWAAGCRDIHRETYDSLLSASRSAFEALGLNRQVSERLVAVFEEFDRATMIELAELYDSNDPTRKTAPMFATSENTRRNGRPT